MVICAVNQRDPRIRRVEVLAEGQSAKDRTHHDNPGFFISHQADIFDQTVFRGLNVDCAANSFHNSTSSLLL